MLHGSGLRPILRAVEDMPPGTDTAWPLEAARTRPVLYLYLAVD
jgi:hypothetical protein